MASTTKVRRPAAGRKRPPLDVDSIAKAALAILDRDGEAGLTMRAVAQSLGVSVMALYHHLPDKYALLLTVQEAAQNEVPLPETTGDGWNVDMLQLARWMRRGLLAHPGLVDVRRVAQGWTARTGATSERWLSLWQQSGLPFSAAVRGAAASATAIVGAIEQEVIARRLPDTHGDLLAGDYPSVRAAERYRAELDPDVEFDFFVRSLIEGLHRTLTEEVQQ
jgi:AcrR family transcriptional regulator